VANEVFGFGNWDAETVEMNRVHEPVQIRTWIDWRRSRASRPEADIPYKYAA
jgi:hypothetical protein